MIDIYQDKKYQLEKKALQIVPAPFKPSTPRFVSLCILERALYLRKGALYNLNRARFLREKACYILDCVRVCVCM